MGGIVIAIRRKTRETLRHERAVVRQQLGADAAADPRPEWEANLRRADELRKFAIRAGYRNPEGGETDARTQSLGVVTGKSLAGGKGTSASPKPCKYCGLVGGHRADCPVIS